MMTEHHNYDQAVPPSVNKPGRYDSFFTSVGTLTRGLLLIVILSDHRPKEELS